ncbi:LrgB family protein [Alicyclobacillus cycloheptanicus]|uniref:Murein hydrolase (TIGR00659 family) n=1 Tax=Alicyclobacillus cycloheptanicus TaxID=1457 RepID=A0ABT9XFZ2_9BACL|nr:LrgB family protein [Alicyclobacillus cycloheptanicus]MDQ0189195.1 putative murein hydrolase (TIGR00659 family) [Alicyclobacillus cycloheptanicus]WDM00381.1 LrgB family protein [Alicyclobacillus cycloheptanicus]
MIALVCAVGTVLIFLLSQRVYRRWRFVLLSPMLTSFAAVSMLLLLTHVPYHTYMKGAQYFTDALQPATMAFAIPFYRNFHLFRRHAKTILLSLVTGSLVAMLSSVELAKWFHLSGSIVPSIAPRSVTTPIAMEISQTIGGAPVLTAVFVLMTGIIGILVGPKLIRWLRIQSPIGQGTLMGMGAHGIGTARAFEESHEAGTIASLSMILAGCITVVLAPLLSHVLLH